MVKQKSSYSRHTKYIIILTARPYFSPVELAVYVRREARCYSRLCILLAQRCR